MKKISKFLTLPINEKILLIKSLILLIFIRTSFLFFQSQYILNFIEKITEKSIKRNSNLSIQRIIWAVDASNNVLNNIGKCLVKSLVIKLLLAEQGYNSTIRFGVIKNTENFLEAHAWLENDMGVIFDQSQIKKYTPLIKSAKT